MQETTASLGEPVRSVIVNDARLACPDTIRGIPHVAINVAVVPGSALPGLDPNVPSSKALLATSCRTGAGQDIFFVDPGSNDLGETDVEGEIVHTLRTRDFNGDFAPPNGWGALAFRGDRIPQDIIACANADAAGEPYRIYSIDLETGDVTFLFEHDTDWLEFPCDGLGWDPWRDVIYVSPDLSDTVYPYFSFLAGGSASPLAPVTVPAPSCFRRDTGGEIESGNSGVLAIGPDMLLACNTAASSSIVQVTKSGATVGSPFPSGVARAEDLECDDITFATPNVMERASVAWTKDAFTPTFHSFRVPNGSCGLCLSPTEMRRDLNSFDAATQRDLALLIEEYVTAELVGIHASARPIWHGTAAFFPGHRGYLAGLELWLRNVKGRPEFFPLPKWNPANEIPEAFAMDLPVGAPESDRRLWAGTDKAACCDQFQDIPMVGNFRSDCIAGLDPFCLGIDNRNLNRPLPPELVYDGPRGLTTTAGLCAYDTIEEVRGDFNSTRPSLEDYHNGVHGPTEPMTGDVRGVEGTMAPLNVASSAVIFWPWHAFVDDVARDFECQCNEDCQACANIFSQPDSMTALTLGGADGEPALATAPVGFWWWFEDSVHPPELSPRLIHDHAGFSIEGTVHGHAELVPGIVGQSLRLDGRDDFVEIRDPFAGELGPGDFTIDAWVKTAGSAIQPILDKRDRAGRGYALFLSDGRLGLFLGGRRQLVVLGEASSIADGAWHHVAAVVSTRERDGSGLFVDGELVREFDAKRLGRIKSHAPLWIGRSRAPHGHGPFDRWHRKRHARAGLFAGEIDEIDLFRYALTPDLIASIYKAGSAGKYGSLGNLPTSAGRPPCLVELGEMIGAMEHEEAHEQMELFDRVIAALQARRLGQARALLRELRDSVPVPLHVPYTDHMHAIRAHADQCLLQRDLRRAAGL